MAKRELKVDMKLPVPEEVCQVIMDAGYDIFFQMNNMLTFEKGECEIAFHHISACFKRGNHSVASFSTEDMDAITIVIALCLFEAVDINSIPELKQIIKDGLQDYFNHNYRDISTVHGGNSGVYRLQIPGESLLAVATKQ